MKKKTLTIGSLIILLSVSVFSFAYAQLDASSSEPKEERKSETIFDNNILLKGAGTTQYETFDPGTINDWKTIYDTLWQSMTFTSTSSIVHNIDTISLSLKRIGDLNCNLIADLTATVSSKPSSTTWIASTSIAANDVATSSFTWTDFTFSTPTSFLNLNTLYGIILHMPCGTVSTNIIRWGFQDGVGYPYGTNYESNDGGNNWGSTEGYDLGFEIFGYASTTETESTSTDAGSSFITDPDTYPFIFFFMIVLFFMSFTLAIKT